MTPSDALGEGMNEAENDPRLMKRARRFMGAAPSIAPLYFIGADRGDLWIPVHTTGCATEEEARKVLAMVRDADADGGPFAVIRSYGPSEEGNSGS